MAYMVRWVRDVLIRSASPLRKFLISGFKVVSDVEKLEEENWECINPAFSTLFILVKSSNHDIKYWANLDMVRAQLR